MSKQVIAIYLAAAFTVGSLVAHIEKANCYRPAYVEAGLIWPLMGLASVAVQIAGQELESRCGDQAP